MPAKMSAAKKSSTLRAFRGGKSVQIRSYFLSVFSCVRTEYGDLRNKSPYLV